MDTLLQDVRFALRSLLKTPGFAVVAVLTLGVGIGASTAIFSAVNGILLRPLPYEEPGRVVRLLGTRADGGGRGTISYPDVLDWRAQGTSFAEVAAYDEWTVTLTGTGEPERLAGASVTSPFFSVLGVRPALGRFFLPAEDTPGHEPVVVLSHGLWQRRYGGDPAVVGRRVTINGTEYTVVGVTSPEFEDPALSGASFGSPQLWRATPAYFNPEQSSRSGRAFTAVARLRPGVSLERASAEASAIARRLEERFPEENTGYGVRLVPLQEEITAPVRPALLVLLAATGMVVLLACANLANLLLARASGRRREIAVRAALGASRARVARQLLTESVVLSLLGGAVGVALAAWTSGPLVALGGESLARAGQVGIDRWVLAFAAGASLLTGLLFGVAPALQASAVDVHTALKEGARGSTPGRSRRLRETLVAAEVAISLLLLSSAALLIRSLWTLQSVDPGFRAGGVLTMELSPPPLKYDTDEKLGALYDRLLARLGALPGAAGVAAVDILPLGGSFNGMGIVLEDRPVPPVGEGPSVETRSVTPGFFGTLGIPVVRGRSFSDADRAGAPTVAVIDRAMADLYWPGQDPIGRRLTVYDGTSWEIVGVVGPVRQFSLDQPATGTLYLPRAQVQPWIGGEAVVVLRSDGDPMALAAAARRAVAAVDPDIPVSRVRPMQGVVAASVAQPRFRTLLLGLFAGIAFFLGAVGIYGVVAYGVSRRTGEFGIRLALGADRRAILLLVLRQGMAPVAVGCALGLAGALAAGRTISAFLFGVAPGDPLTLAGVAAVLGAVALLASYLPARRATRVDPLTALRTE